MKDQPSRPKGCALAPKAGPAITRVAVVDDYPLTRKGIEATIAQQDGMDVACSVGSLAELAPTRPDILLLDLYFDGERLTQAEIMLQVARQPVLVLSGPCPPIDVLEAVDAGALGYLTKEARPEDLVAAIQAVADGNPYLSEQLADFIDADMRQVPPRRNFPPLSEQESKALALIAEGLPIKQVATLMGVAPGTVNEYVRRIHVKYGPGNKAFLTALAIELGIYKPQILLSLAAGAGRRPSRG
jgi:two-component system, NarL family, nitrate/nitrite response regulator NarL